MLIPHVTHVIIIMSFDVFVLMTWVNAIIYLKVGYRTEIRQNIIPPSNLTPGSISVNVQYGHKRFIRFIII